MSDEIESVIRMMRKSLETVVWEPPVAVVHPDIAPGLLTNLFIEALEHGFKDEVSCSMQEPDCTIDATMRWRSRCPVHGVISSPLCADHAVEVMVALSSGYTLQHDEGCGLECEHLDITPL